MRATEVLNVFKFSNVFKFKFSEFVDRVERGGDVTDSHQA